MESQKPKIAMYVKRNFGEKLSASFDFIKENWKLMLKFTTYLLLPICLIQALSLNGLMGYIAVLTDLSGGGGLSDASLMMSFFSYYSLYMFNKTCHNKHRDCPHHNFQSSFRSSFKRFQS